MSDKLLVVNCAFWMGDKWRWAAPLLAEEEIEWKFFMSNGTRKNNLLTCWQAVRAANRAPKAVLVTHGARVAVACAFFRALLRSKVPQIDYQFHWEVLPSRLKTTVTKYVIRNIDRFITYSKAEAKLCEHLFDIPAERIEAIYWPDPEGGGAFQPLQKEVDASLETPLISGDYIAAVGKSGRDYGTLFKAMKLLPDIPLVAVVQPHAIEGLEVPDNVKVFTYLDYDKTKNIIKFSRSMVMPMAATGSQSGHCSLVLAMQLGTPSIVSDIPPLAEYVQDGNHAVVCPPADPEALAACIRSLWNDPARGQAMAARAKQFALEHCTIRNSADHFLRYLHNRGLMNERSTLGRQAASQHVAEERRIPLLGEYA